MGICGVLIERFVKCIVFLLQFGNQRLSPPRTHTTVMHSIHDGAHRSNAKLVLMKIPELNLLEFANELSKAPIFLDITASKSAVCPYPPSGSSTHSPSQSQTPHQ